MSEDHPWLLGGCHCRAVRFRVRPRSRRVLNCNCSICAMKGFLHVIVAPEDFELLFGEENLRSYRFNTKVAHHRFCVTCGIHPFYTPRSHPDQVDVNLNCLDEKMREKFEVEPFDGANWEANVASIQKSAS